MNFYTDTLIFEDDFCNFESEKRKLYSMIESGEKVKIYGPRNYGKTSLIKNIISKKWVGKKPKSRIVVYSDFYSVDSLEDITQELYLDFQKSLNEKKNLKDKSIDLIKAFKFLRPTFTPSDSPSELGSFSLKFYFQKEGLNFEKIFNEINRMYQESGFEFLIILDEFQEIGKIKKAEAKLRGALQELDKKIPVVILGSKQHLLTKIFENPKAPFYSWGRTIEMKPIDFNKYTDYMNQRLATPINYETGVFLQNKLNRIPEAINKFGIYLNKRYERSGETTNKNNSSGLINEFDHLMDEYIDNSRSIFEEIYSNFSHSEKEVLKGIVSSSGSEITNPTGKLFLARVQTLSKATVPLVIKKLLDSSTISKHINEKSEVIYKVTDPYLSHYILRNKTLR